MRPHRGVTILVFGILGLVVCQLFVIAAWRMGDTDLEDMANGSMDPTGRDMTKAGRICGIVATALLAVQIIFVVVIFISMALARQS